MKFRRVFSLLVFVSFLCGSFLKTDGSPRSIFEDDDNFHMRGKVQFFPTVKNSSEFVLSSRTVKSLSEKGIKEDIPKKYREKFEKWKAEFIATELGRGQWEFYSNNKNFLLTLKISEDEKQGAKTDEYLWDEQGNFVGATISLGKNSEKGIPDPVYYPVMGSLTIRNSLYSVEENLLAATKIAHEIGHVNQTFKETKESFELRSKLMPVYISIFLKNGYNIQDEKLVELAEQMGGTPMKIWESREYWSEVNSMLFLKEKISKEFFFCNVFGRIKTNIKTYAKNYEDRFDAARIPVCEK